MHLTTKVVRRAPQGISDLLEAEGRFVYRRPRTVIVVSLLFALLWTVLFFALFEQELDRDKLFTPENSRAFDDQEYVEALYGEPDLEVNSPCGFNRCGCRCHCSSTFFAGCPGCPFLFAEG